MNINEIHDLIKFVSKSGVSEVEIQSKDFKIIIKTPSEKKGALVTGIAPLPLPAMGYVNAPSAAPESVPAVTPAPAKQVVKPGADESNYITIKSPMIGTFYRSSSPDKPSFVNVGDEIQPGKVICIIEAMKLFNEIESEVKGKIVKVLVDDSKPVEYDQPLFLVDPS